jgi:type I restriction enzyme M protein
MTFTSRFREFCPETGKKADLTFVQHIIASLRPDGHHHAARRAVSRRYPD